MTVSSFQLLFDRGDASPLQKVSALSRSSTVEAALRCMIAEGRGAFKHRVKFKMTDGSTVVAKPRAGATT